MATLYEITGKFELIQSLIEEGADEEIFEEALSNINAELAEKLEGYAMVIKNMESDVEGFKSEEKRLADRRRAMENKIKRMREDMQESMTTAGQKKVKGNRFSFNVQNSPMSLKVNDDKWIPEGYWIPQEPKLNRKELLDDLKQGEEIPGVEITQGEHLRIR